MARTRPAIARRRPQIGLAARPDLAYAFGKRCIDIVVSLFLLALLLPLLGALAIAVRCTSAGPALFRQKRLARSGREFWCYKFRTMAADAEDQLKQRADLRQAFAADYKIRDDPRVTRLGALLRKTSLDELPQFYNVLRGDMTLIGPRPIVPPELAKYGAYGDMLLTVKPGLGGMWQVEGRSDTTYEERIELDMRYIRERSLALDLQLLWRTAVCVLCRRGAC